MYLKHITLKNFRAYYGEHTLEFSPTLGHSISIVAGNNGHGKTSLLTALLWCLYGRQIEQVEESYKNDIKAKKNYENYIRDLVNRKALEDEIPMAPRSYQVRSLAKPNSIDYKNNHMYVELVVGDFTLPFLTSEENQSMQLTLTIRRSVRIVSGVPFDSLSVIGSGTESFAFEDDSTRQTFILNYVLPVEMAKFYLFDAERVVQIAQNFDSRDMQKQLAQNFEEIFGIKKYVEVKAKLQASYERQKKEAAPLGKQMKLNDLERRILGAEREYEDVKNQIDRLESQRSELDDERTELYTQVTDSRTVSRQDYEDARRQYEIKHSEEAHYKELLGKELANAPLLLLARRLEEFNSCLEIELKHEEQVRQLNAQRREAHKISGTIRRELESLNEKWIQSSEYGEYISQPIMNEISTKINEVLESTLAPADTIKTKPPTNFRKDFSENELAHFTRSLDQVMKGGGASKLAKLIANYRQVKNDALAIQARIRDMEGRLESEQTADARKRIQELNEQIKIIDNELGAVQTKLPKIENDLIALKKQRTELLGDIEGIKGVEKRLKVVEALVESLNRFIERLKSEKIDLVERRASEMMRRIFHKEGFIQQFKIESDAHSIRIRLLGADGVVVDFNTVSMGERQIVVTALLHALIHESHFSFPVFIDSPLQKLDALHRRGILEHFYVGLHTQTVLLPLLESELRTEEYELIRHHIDRCYLITHQDKASRFLPVGTAQLFDTYRHLQTSPTP